jgi:hypothetical protein
VFSELDPFPLLKPALGYREAQAHSHTVDQWLGLRISETEKQIAENTLDANERKEKWVGLDPQALQTPYTEIRTILNALKFKAGETIIDLGAGYGRMGFVVGRHFAESNFIGYEISKERVQEGNRVLSAFDYSNISLREQDLAKADFELPRAEIYFVYDFGTPASIQKMLDRLKEYSKTQPVCVVGRGRGVRDQIERHEFWLSAVVTPQHFGNFSIYRTRERGVD